MKFAIIVIIRRELDFISGRNPASLEIADVVLAISQTIASSFTSPPDNDSLIPIVAERNKIPLPLIPERFGIRAPPVCILVL